ncbi:MAG: hypothetical protein AB9M60_20815 [Leptothrix sp. (in: b-proteobacteria)]
MNKIPFAALCLALPLSVLAADAPAPAVAANAAVAQEQNHQVILNQRQRGMDMGRCRQESTDKHLTGIDYRQAVAKCMAETPAAAKLP